MQQHIFLIRYAGQKQLQPKDNPSLEREWAKENEEFSDVSAIPIGSRIRFYPILKFIQKEIDEESGDYKKVVAKHFPNVSDGLPASLLHGLIQLGNFPCPVHACVASFSI